MPNIRSIIRPEAEQMKVEKFVEKPDYFTRPRMNPSSLAQGLIGKEVNPTAIKMEFEKPYDGTWSPSAKQDQLDRGTLAHLMLLQPEQLLDRVAVWNGGRRQYSEWDKFVADNPGKLLIKADDYTEIKLAVEAMRQLPDVRQLLEGIDVEVAMIGTTLVRGHHIAVKGQVDVVNFDRKLIVDVKTTATKFDQRTIERTIRDLHYREKISLYRRWLSEATNTDVDEWRCKNLFLSLNQPGGVRIVSMTTSAMEWGEERMNTAMDAVVKCLDADTWPLHLSQSVMGVEQYECDDDFEDLDDE